MNADNRSKSRIEKEDVWSCITALLEWIKNIHIHAHTQTHTHVHFPLMKVQAFRDMIQISHLGVCMEKQMLDVSLLSPHHVSKTLVLSCFCFCFSIICHVIVVHKEISHTLNFKPLQVWGQYLSTVSPEH